MLCFYCSLLILYFVFCILFVCLSYCCLFGVLNWWLNNSRRTVSIYYIQGISDKWQLSWQCDNLIFISHASKSTVSFSVTYVTSHMKSLMHIRIHSSSPFYGIRYSTSVIQWLRSPIISENLLLTYFIILLTTGRRILVKPFQTIEQCLAQLWLASHYPMEIACFISVLFLLFCTSMHHRTIMLLLNLISIYDKPV